MADQFGLERWAPAVVTAVHSETCVSLTVFPEELDDPHPAIRRTSVVQGTGVGDWRWPPRA